METLGSLEVLNAIYHRRAVRRYQPVPVTHSTLEALLDAAIAAPSALNEQPWAFAIVEGAERLNEYSNRAKLYLMNLLDGPFPHAVDGLGPEVNLFHAAPALIVVCSTSGTPQATEDCCLAAENIMLAAVAKGLGTCPIGFARPWLSLAATKRELGIPEHWKPVFPLVVGHPDGESASPGRRPARVVWSD